MTRRRTFLIGGAASVALAVGAALGAERAGLVDDAAEALGIDPVPVPDPRDEALLATVAAEHARLVAWAAVAPEPVRTVLAEQARIVGPVATDRSAPIDPGALRTALADAATRRAGQALDAVSPALARTLASLAAGLGVLAVQEI